MQEGQAVENLHANDLTILLQWHQVPKVTEGKMEAKRKKWQDILESGNAAKIYKKWLDTEESELNRLKLKAINIADTAGRLNTENMNLMKATIKSMTKEKKEVFLHELLGLEDELHEDYDINEGSI